jgi:hypothetical protein
MDVFGITIPLWAVFLGIIILVILAWKIIKFALKVLIIFLVGMGVLIGLDFIGLFSWLQTLMV